MERKIIPKSQSAKRALKGKEPKLVENPKSLLQIRTQKTNDIVTAFVKDLSLMKKPLVRSLKRRNKILPFEDRSHLEFLCGKNDTSLVSVVSHSKKKPSNVVLGRLFDRYVLDMYEFGLKDYKEISEFKNRKFIVASNIQPVVQFQGKEFSENGKLFDFRNFLLDFYCGKNAETVSLTNIKRVLCFISKDEKTVLVRQFAVKLTPSGASPIANLEEMGPSFEMNLRRSYEASQEAFKEAMKHPKPPAKVKNVSRDEFGNKMGKVYVDRQDLTKLPMSRFKGFKRRRKVGQTKENSDK